MSRLFESKLFFLLTFLKVAVGQENRYLVSFDWSTIEPSTNLSWVDCYSGFQCARYQVPLNYSNPDDCQTAAIAVIKLNATIEESSQYGGPIFVNPGGPGASGVDFALQAASTLQSIVGSHFDIIGFDPRGIKNSTPKISVFQAKEESKEERSNWFAREAADLNSTADALPEAWARYQVFGQLAQNRDHDSDGFLDFVTTDNVARDMLGMVEALGEEKLQYYGGSYGTVLGAVFSTMFPDRVGRVVIDGCLDMDSYFRNDLKNQMVDTDKAMQAFFDGCHSAGPEACAFFNSSPSQIEANLEAIYDSVCTQPVPVFSGETYGVITYDALRLVVVGALQSANFPMLAAGLAELSTGNGTAIYQMFAEGLSETVAVTESMIAIKCSDADLLHVDWGSIWLVFIRLLLERGWEFHPNSRFKGPVGGNTSFPLVIGNTADPITSLSASKKTSLSFPGSVLLQQDSVGHTAFSSQSSCTFQHLAAYFNNGTLPEEGTICPTDIPLFPSADDTDASGTANSARSLPLFRRRY
ncbi:alpha/beta-hydrolase [Dendrothele bispora CBS 962.96]|uniref:Alpha/beta-hydrolase n=1 Tax=Dendrothele bispora (strain CBS 962.96) TaxID=1314807 RepID=A0A4V4HH45_DENBC|nr:alpha/beta-hydrolase [Dendrothele bispora CBS 962.96]